MKRPLNIQDLDVPEIDQMDHQDLNAKLLVECMKHLSPTAKRRIFAEYKRRRVGMASTETAGHSHWYPIHLKAERHASDWLGVF